MNKSVREQVEAGVLELGRTGRSLESVKNHSDCSMVDLGRAVMREDDARTTLAQLVKDNRELFAAAEETAAEVARLRGVMAAGFTVEGDRMNLCPLCGLQVEQRGICPTCGQLGVSQIFNHAALTRSDNLAQQIVKLIGHEKPEVRRDVLSRLPFCRTCCSDVCECLVPDAK